LADPYAYNDLADKDPPLPAPYQRPSALMDRP
jgi:hypothetical protein